MSNYYHDVTEEFQNECKALYSALVSWENAYMNFADDPAIAEYIEAKGINLEPFSALWNEYMFGNLGEALEAFNELDLEDD